MDSPLPNRGKKLSIQPLNVQKEYGVVCRRMRVVNSGIIYDKEDIPGIIMLVTTIVGEQILSLLISCMLYVIQFTFKKVRDKFILKTLFLLVLKSMMK